jgi:prophage tail gpP-like protein
MSDPSEIAVLNVGGRKYTGWTSIMLERTYGATCSHFEFASVQPLDSGLDFKNWKIAPHDSCTITLGGILAFTGYVFVRQSAFNAQKRGLLVTGRSKTADAVDSSVPVNGGQYKGYTFQALASALAKSVDVNLLVRGTSPTLTQPIPQFSIAWGETAFMAVERLARLRGLHLTDDANGNWIADVFNPNEAAAGQLIEGKNLLEARASVDGSNSFNTTNIAAQRPGNDQVKGAACRDNSATVTNPKIRANRRQMMLMEEPGSSQDCAARANVELAQRATDLVDVVGVVQGWMSAPGTLWDIRQNYSVKSPTLDLENYQLTSRNVKYTQSEESGTRTEISLCTSQSLAFAGTNISKTAVPGEPAYSAGTPTDGATPDPPDDI